MLIRVFIIVYNCSIIALRKSDMHRYYVTGIVSWKKISKEVSHCSDNL